MMQKPLCPNAVSPDLLKNRPVFFVTSKPPFPPDDGQKIPVANYHNAAIRFGAVPEVIVLTKQQVRSKMGKLSILAKRLSPVGGFYASEVLTPTDRDHLLAAERPIVFVTPARLLGQIAPLKARNPGLRIVLLLNDAKWPMYLEALQYGLGVRAGGGRVDLLKGLLTPITYLKELTAYRAADVVVVQTERERGKLGWLAAKSIAAMNAITAPSVAWAGDQSTVLTMQVNFTNRRANKWRPFVQDIWPQIQKKHPELTLELFGPGDAEPPEWVQNAAGVKYLGRIDDLGPHLARCRMLLMPLEHSTGVSNMVLHGLSMDMPIMISGTAKDGVADLLPGRSSVFVANTVADQAAQTIAGLAHSHRTTSRDLAPTPAAIGSWTENLRLILRRVLD